jgi:hypothetical protein
MHEINWSNGWHSIADAIYQVRLAAELSREIENNPKHVLFGKPIVFIAEWIGSREKDFIVCVEDGSYARVHLTYHLEHNPNWPCADLIKDKIRLQEYIDRFPEDPIE